MWWSLRTSSTSRTSWSWYVTTTQLERVTQISPPYSHQSQGTVERFHKTLNGQVRAIRIGLADQLGLHSDHFEGSLLLWIVQHAVFQTNRYLVRSDRRASFEKMFKKTLRSHELLVSESVFSLTFRLSTRLKNCRSDQPLKSMRALDRQRRCHRHAHRQPHRWSDPQDSHRHSLGSRKSFQYWGIQEVHSSDSWIHR